MWWFILIAVVIIAGISMPRFGAVLLALTFVGGVVLYGFDRRAKSERAASLTRIGSGDLEFVDVALLPDHSGYRLVGRLRNRSREYTLSTLRLKLTVQDCGNADRRFEVLAGELQAAHAAGDVPVAQARAQELRQLRMAVPSRQPLSITAGWKPTSGDTACETIDEYEKTIYSNIPPVQARDVSERVYVSLDRPNNMYQWHYEIFDFVAR
jgi:hypothetical protein